MKFTMDELKVSAVKFERHHEEISKEARYNQLTKNIAAEK